MKTKRISTIFLVSGTLTVLFLLTQAAAAQTRADWKKFTPRQGDFTVIAPSPIEESEVPNPQFPSMKLRLYTASDGGTSFVIAAMKMPVAAIGSKAALDILWASYSKGVCEPFKQSTMKCELKVVKNDISPTGGVKEFQLFLDGNYLGSGRIYVTKGAFYSLQIIGLGLKADDEQTQRFFTSFATFPR